MENNNYKIILEEMNKALDKFSSGSENLNAYDYEKKFREITDKYEQKLFQASMGKVSQSKNEKKTIQTSFGKTRVKKKDIQ